MEGEIGQVRRRTAAERLAHINRYEAERLAYLSSRGPVPEPLPYRADITAWIAHLSVADPRTLMHMVGVAEYLPESPEAEALREAAEYERARRAVGIGVGCG